MDEIKKNLQEVDLRSISGVEQFVPLIKTQNDFDELSFCLYSENRLTVFRAVNSIEITNVFLTIYLHSLKKVIIWLVFLMVYRLDLSEKNWSKFGIHLRVW